MTDYFHTAVFIVIFSLLVSGCFVVPGNDVSKGEKIIVTVSILPQKYFVERIGGDKVKVLVMIPPGASPASYEPGPDQLRAISEADLYIMIGAGLPFENVWMDKIRDFNKKMFVVNSSEGIQLRPSDPHVWLSPRLVKIQAENIYRGLLQVDEKDGDYYRQNLDKFLKDLDELDNKIKMRIEDIKNRKFMVFHPSWSYFAQDYGLIQIPIEVEGKEPSPGVLKHLVDTARREDIHVVFVSPQFSTKSAEAIAREINGRVEYIDPLSYDYMSNLLRVADAISAAGR